MSLDQLTNLLGRLDRVRKLRSTRFKIIFLCTVIGLFGYLFMAFSLLDIALKFPMLPRILASSGCLAILLVAAIKLIQTGLAQRREYRGVAAEVERVYPEVETALSTSVEFGHDDERTARLSSSGVVAALVADTQERTGGLNFLRSVNWRAAKIAAVLFLIAATICGVYTFQHSRLAHLTFMRMVQPWRDLPPPTLTLADVYPRDCEVRKLGDIRISARLSGKMPKECRIVYGLLKDDPSGDSQKRQARPDKWLNEPMTMQEGAIYAFTFSRLTQSVKFRVLAGDFRSDEHLIDVYEIPRVVRINMTLTAPEYCGLPAKEIKDSIGPISALRGTVVRIDAFANKPLRRAGIRFSSGEPDYLPATQAKPDELTTEFTIHKSDRYKIWLADADGRTNEDAVFYTIKALDDKKPVVKLTRPKKEIKARKTTEVPLEVTTEDDYGIEQVGIAYKVKTEDPVRVPLDEFKERIKKAKSQDTLYLEDLELGDTDIVTYYAYAVDNDTVAGPKLGASDLHFIEITPYAQQYMKEEKKGGDGKKEEEDKDKQIIAKLEDIIKAQKEVLTKTFRLDKTLPPKLNDAQVNKVLDIGSTEESLQKTTRQLARRLVESLMKWGLEEQIDRAEHLWRGSNEMGIAAYVLSKGSTATGLQYENTALYHLYRAKRDLIKLIQETKDPEMRKRIEQALASASKQQQEDQEQDLEKEMEELRQQAKEMEQMRDKQKELNEQMQKMAAEKLAKERGDSTPKQDGKPTPKPGQVAKKQNQLAQQADKKTEELNRMEQQSDKLPAKPARDMDKAAWNMKEAAKSLMEKKPDQARDRGKEADERLRKALREVKRAMEKSLAQQLKDAAEQTKEIAQRQKALGKEAQQQEQRDQQPTQVASAQQKSQQDQADAQSKQQQGQQSQSAQRDQQEQEQKQTGSAQAKAQPKETEDDQQQKQTGSAQAKTQPKDAQDAQQQQQAQGRQPEQPKQTGLAQAKAEQKDRDEAQQRAGQEQLAEKQGEVRRDLAALGRKLQQLGEQVEKTEPEIGKRVKQLGQKAEEGRAQEQMQKAEDELKNKQLAAARAPQREAEKHTDKLAKDVREAAEQFAMDDEERLARAIDKAEKLAEEQGQVNEQTAKAQKAKPSQPTRKQQAEQAAKKQEAVRKETQTLAKQVDRIRILQEAEMEEQVRDKVEKAAELMASAKQQLERQDPDAAQRKGTEARKELDDTIKEMRRQMKEALNQKLAKAVDAAKKSLEAQRSAKAETQEATQQQTKSGKPQRRSPSRAAKPSQATAEQRAAQQKLARAAKKAAEDQDTAKEKAEQLKKELADIERQAKTTHPELSKDVDKVAREMNARKPVQRMTQAERELERRDYRSAERHQDAAEQALARAHGKLNDLYQDSTSKPLQTLKAAQKEAEELRKQMDQLQKKSNQLNPQVARNSSTEPSQRNEEAEKALLALQKKQMQAQEKTDRFADRMERLNPTEEDQKALEDLKGKMAEVTSKLAERELRNASAGLSKSQKRVQEIGQGIIKRIKRIVDERKRKEPIEEHAPDEYKELVRRYYEALSAK